MSHNQQKSFFCTVSSWCVFTTLEFMEATLTRACISEVRIGKFQWTSPLVAVKVPVGRDLSVVRADRSAHLFCHIMGENE